MTILGSIILIKNFKCIIINFYLFFIQNIDKIEIKSEFKENEIKSTQENII